MRLSKTFHTIVTGGLIVTLGSLAIACTDGEAAVGTTTAVAPVATTTTTLPTTTTTTLATTTTTTLATTTTTMTPAVLVDVNVYFLLDGRLVVANREVAGPGVLRGALEALLAGPTPDELAAGMTSTVPAGTSLGNVDLDEDEIGGVATVDLSSAFGTGGGSLSMFARVAQVVFTATQFDNVDRVAFWMDGAPIEVLGGEGLILDEPQTRMMVDRELSGSVIIDSPRHGETVTSPIRVTGEGDVYEGQFPIEIWQDGIQVGGLAPVTAGAMGTWAAFDITIPFDAEPGPIELIAYDAGGCGTEPGCPEPIRTVVELQFAG